MRTTPQFRLARIAIFYAIASALWIVSTDWLLHNVASGIEELARLQTYKGIVFVTLSSLIIYIILIYQHRKHTETYNRLRIESVRADAQLTERSRELESSRRQFNEAEQITTRLMGDLAHSLRTPLTSLNIRLEMIRRVPPELRESYLDGVTEQVQYLNRLVNDMLDLTAFDNRNGHMELIPLDFNEQVALAVAIHQPQAEQNGLQLIFEPGSELPSVLAESTSMVRMVDNLIANGVKYTQTGRVEIRTDFDSTRNRVRLVVQDTGIGIPPEDMTRLFDRFFRGRSARKVGPMGSGLGLGIVRRTLDILEGEIDVQSEVGRGSTFTVWLPPAPDNL
ncbi:MAG: sensor histidine kinase [Phototrophicaceae bacterium]